MKAVALVVPVLVLALVHLLQRLEAWALGDRASDRQAWRAVVPEREARTPSRRAGTAPARGDATGAPSRG